MESMLQLHPVDHLFHTHPFTFTTVQMLKPEVLSDDARPHSLDMKTSPINDEKISG